MTKSISWMPVYMYLYDHGVISAMGRSTMYALKQYILMNSVTVREVAIMISVYMAGMSVDSIAHGLLAIA